MFQEQEGEPVGALLRRARKATGKSQERVAEALGTFTAAGFERSDLSRWETGKRIPTPLWRERLCAVLGLPLDAVDRACAVAEAHRAGAAAVIQGDRDVESVVVPALATAADPAMATDQRHVVSRRLDQALQRWDEHMRRRTFFSAAVTVGGTLWPVDFAAPPPSTDRAAVYKTFAEVTSSYRTLDRLLGPLAVYSQAVDHHARVMWWLDQARLGERGEFRMVAQLAVDTAELRAWLHFDREQYSEAAAVYRQAAQIARDLDDVSCQAYLIGRMSRTLSECGHHGDALAFSLAARQVAGTMASPRVQSWLAATRAYVYACLGREPECRASIDQAIGALERDNGWENPEPHLAFYDRPHLDKWAGHALLRLADHRATRLLEGRSMIDQVLGAWSQADVRESGEVLVACASARLAQDEIPEAARLTMQAFDIANGTRSPRVMRHVTGMRARLSPYRLTAAVRDLDERMLTGR